MELRSVPSLVGILERWLGTGIIIRSSKVPTSWLVLISSSKRWNVYEKTLNHLLLYCRRFEVSRTGSGLITGRRAEEHQLSSLSYVTLIHLSLSLCVPPPCTSTFLLRMDVVVPGCVSVGRHHASSSWDLIEGRVLDFNDAGRKSCMCVFITFVVPCIWLVINPCCC